MLNGEMGALGGRNSDGVSHCLGPALQRLATTSTGSSNNGGASLRLLLMTPRLHFGSPARGRQRVPAMHRRMSTRCDVDHPYTYLAWHTQLLTCCTQPGEPAS